MEQQPWLDDTKISLEGANEKHPDVTVRYCFLHQQADKILPADLALVLMLS